MKKTIIKVLAGSVCVSAMGYLIYGYQTDVDVVSQNSLSNTVETEAYFSTVNANQNKDANDMQGFISAMSSRMKQQHAHEIDSVMVQLSMSDFRAFVIEQFPENGVSVFQEIMRVAFPMYADTIFTLLSNMRLYNEWHVEMLLTLNEMDHLTRNGTLWGKRRDLFGEQSEQIWQQERDGEVDKQKNVQETLARLQQANDISMTDRLSILTESINQQYGDEHSQLLISKGMVADIYFNLDSVQSDLKNMSTSDRANALADSRRQLGFSEEHISELEKTDKERDARWSNGYEYMAARDQIMALSEGADREEKLKGLRVKHFKHEAPTIEKEESSEFFRYERPRLYGSN